MQRIGTAGWSLPAKTRREGTHLYNYSRELSCTEINSSFYRPHRASTWARWASETPPDFRFSIKAPKSITHEAKLLNTEPLLEDFFAQIEPIQAKVGPILFQLPPSLGFDPAPAESFLTTLRRRYQGEAVLEPRHAEWFTLSADTLLGSYGIARVAADPAKGAPASAQPGGNLKLVYYRLHGTPRTYYSNYDEHFLTNVATAILAHQNAWVIFDNTALSHAYPNALHLQTLIAEAEQKRSLVDQTTYRSPVCGPARQ